jgi:hypothetical protein
MNEEDIFAAALSRDDPEERAAYLEVACAGNVVLRERVEMLLQSHHQAGSFLEQPALGQAAVTGNEGDATGTGADRPGEDDLPLDFLSPPLTPDSLGQLGHYKILKVVGRGGMGLVLKAFDEALHRVVAIKVLAPPLAAAPTARKRFEREARAVAAVSHDHLITIHAVEEAGGRPYFVMQFVEGMSLQERLDQNQPLELKEILRIGMQTASGLAAAHAQGLTHRDVKPANILLENGVQRVKLTDFGLARAADDASLTWSGLISGTPDYMAPEQARGENIDQRADLFSLGSVLYAMCTGRPPFQADNAMAVLKRVCEETPRPIREINPDVPAWLAEIIVKLLAKDPARRFQSAKEVAELLEQRLAHEQQRPTRSQMQQPDRPAPAPARRGPWRRAAAAAVVLALAALGTTEAIGVTHVSAYAAAVLRIHTPDGTLIVEVNDPQVKVTIDGDGDEMTITGAGLQEVSLRPGRYRVRATRDGAPVAVDTELVSITRGDTRVVRVSRAGIAAGQSQNESHTIKAFGPSDIPLTRDGATLDRSQSPPAWRIEAQGSRTVRLYEVPDPGVEQCVVQYRAKMKSANLDGRAYLEMWCRFPEKGRFFSKDLANPVHGTTARASYETPFFLQKGERPDLIQLHLVIEGTGTVWIENIELLRGPLPASKLRK